MLRTVTDLRGYAIRATDGVIGGVHDLDFDDEDWAIRYLVVDTDDWLSGRKVLISPLAIGQPDWMGQLLPVSLTKAQIEKSPDIDTQKPASRQHEAAYFEYYGYPTYWGGAGVPDACHLRSCRAVIGYHIHAKDGDIGHVEDLLVDDHSRAIRYLIVNTISWWLGHHVVVAPQSIEAVSWRDASVSVGLTRQAVKDAPSYAPATASRNAAPSTE